MDQIPLFPDASEHQAFVRVVMLPWPMVGVAYAVVCVACPESDQLLWESYDGAWTVALRHREAHDAWIPREDIPWGPRRLWGPAL